MDIGISIGLLGLNAYRSQLASARQATGRLTGVISRDVGKIGTSFQNLASQVPFIGSSIAQIATPIGAVATATTALTAGLVSATRTAASFEQQLATVGSIAGVERTSEAFQALSAEAQRLGANTEFSATQSAQAMEFLARAGFNTSEIIAGTADTLALATIGQLDLARASDIASDTLSQFGLRADELTKVVDIIAKTVTSSNTNVEQFANAINFLGPQAAALKVPLEETAAVIGVLANNGLKGSLGTRAFGTALTRLAKPTGAAANELERLGINAFDVATGEFVGLANLIGQLEVGFQGFSDQQKQASLATLFGAEAIQEFNILLSAGSSELIKYTREIEEAGLSGGEFAQSIRDIQLDTFQGSVKLLRSAIEALSISIAGPLLNGFSEFTKALASGIRTVADYFTRVGGIGNALRSLVPALSIVSGALIIYNSNLIAAGVSTVALGAAQRIAALATAAYQIALVGIAGLITAYNVAAGVLTGTISLTTVAQYALNLALSLNPIGAVITLVGALVVALGIWLSRQENIIASVKGLGAAVRTTFTQIAENARLVFGGLADVISGAFTLSPGTLARGIGNLSLALAKIGDEAGKAYTDAYNLSVANGDDAGFKNAINDFLSGPDLNQQVNEQAAKTAANYTNTLGKEITKRRDLAVNAITNLGQFLEIKPPDISAFSRSTRNLTELYRQLGFNVNFVNQELGGTSGLAKILESDFFRFGNALGFSAENAARFALNMQEAVDQIKLIAANATIDFFQNVGEAAGKAARGIQSFGDGVSQAFRSFVSAILVEAPKLLGMVLLKSAVSVPFPANVPLALAGIALIGLSGLASGLLSSIPGVQTGNSSSLGTVDIGSPQSSSGNFRNIQNQNLLQGTVEPVQFNPNLEIFIGNERVTDFVIGRINRTNQFTGQGG